MPIKKHRIHFLPALAARWARSHWQSTHTTTSAVVRPSTRCGTREQTQAHPCSAGAENRCHAHQKTSDTLSACPCCKMGAIALTVNLHDHQCGGKAFHTLWHPRTSSSTLQLKTGAMPIHKHRIHFLPALAARWARSHWQSTHTTTSSVVRPSTRSGTREQAQAHPCSAGAENRCHAHQQTSDTLSACPCCKMGAIALTVNLHDHQCGGKALHTLWHPRTNSSTPMQCWS